MVYTVGPRRNKITKQWCTPSVQEEITSQNNGYTLGPRRNNITKNAEKLNEYA